MSHTKGPWHVAYDQQSHGEHKVIEDENNWIIARIPNPSPHHKDADYAYMRLLAASPCLLAALEALRESVVDYEDDPAIDAAKELADAAISKARSK